MGMWIYPHGDCPSGPAKTASSRLNQTQILAKCRKSESSLTENCIKSTKNVVDNELLSLQNPFFCDKIDVGYIRPFWHYGY